ncbi:MBOAT family O-acyltransferase [Halocola ammonii]
MVFSSIVFLFFFLPLVLLVYFMLPGVRQRNVFLLLASLVFYAWGEPVFVLLMLFSCAVNYTVGLVMSKAAGRKWPLVLGVVVNLLILVIAKYSDFMVENLNTILPEGNKLSQPNIPLPIGVSFFTFQAISYLVDIWRNQAHVQKNPLRLSLYIALFPQLIAGPIVRYHHIATELHRRVHHFAMFRYGVERFVIGLAKKVLIANPMGQYADSVIAESGNWDTPSAWMAIVAYSLQIYYDFSGYSDMAIGLGRMFGFNFHENFNFPYRARSIQEFWRRWHISLSTWFRDYVYIPLGGNRLGDYRTYFNLTLVFFLTGLWHGASWNFVFWGMLHGTFLIVERLGFKNVLQRIGGLANVYTLLVVVFAWVFFRIESFGDAWKFVGEMFSFHVDDSSIPLSRWQLTALSFGVVFCFDWWTKLKLPTTWQKPTLAMKQFLLLFIFVVSCLEVATSTYNPFIYFRF